MTEDYKKNLLDYITDNLEETPSSLDEVILNYKTIPRSKWSSYIPSYWQDFRYEGMIEGNESTSNLSIIYGGYIDSDGNVRGIITLVDDNFIPVKTFYKYSNGTYLRYIQYMKQADDGTFYFIDDEAFSYMQRQQTLTSQKRFVMISNITVKNATVNDYILNFRTSYILPDAYKNFYCHNMYKDPNSSHYIFFGGSVDTSTPQYTYRKLSIFGLKVNVGMANEWTSYVDQKNLSMFGSAIATFNNNSDVRFRCMYTPISISSNDIKCVSKGYTGSVSDTTIVTYAYKPYIDEGYQKKQSVFTSWDVVYYVQNNSYWGVEGVARPKYIGLYKYDFSSNEHSTIFEKYLGDYDYTYQEYIMIDRNDTELYIEYINNYDEVNATADYYVQHLVIKWNPLFIGGGQPCVFNRRSFFVKSNYNLVQLYTYGINPQQRNWFYDVVKEDYYTANYNSIPYVNSNVLVPQKTRLYSGEDLIFARNLYNVSKQNNMTMSSVEIPNTYLNEDTITQNDLIGKTNIQLNSNTQNWTKNIYEVVDLNFLNTISVINEDTGDSYLESAVKINNAITDGGDTNYQNTPCNKYRINYTDNTTSIKPLYWTSIDDLHRETMITFYVDKAISSIDFISNDETTIYLKLPIEVEVGKYYSINQKVRIGE